VDAGTAALVGALTGGLLTVIGGLLATLWLARLEQGREERSARARHATAVRIVFLELQSNGVALINLARGVKSHPMSTAAYLSVAPDLYAFLPADLAADVSFAYTISTYERLDAVALEDLLARWLAILARLSEYGKTLGLALPAIGESSPPQ
jgi:hypothetical protein